MLTQQPVLFVCDYQSQFVCKLFRDGTGGGSNDDGFQSRLRSLPNATVGDDLFSTRLLGGPPVAMRLSKFSDGELRILLVGDKYVSAFNVETLLFDPPLSECLIPVDVQARKALRRNLFHVDVDRTVHGKMLGGEFGETSNIILTASEQRGIILCDLREATKLSRKSLMGKVRLTGSHWHCTWGCNQPNRTLRSVVFDHGCSDVVALTQNRIVVIDRKMSHVPKAILKLPISPADSAHRITLARASLDNLWPAWVSTVRGGVLLCDLDPTRQGTMTTRCCFQPDPTGLVSSIATHPYDPAILTTGSSRGLVSIWDAEQILKAANSPEEAVVEPIGLLGHDRWVWALDFSRDGRLLVSASSDATIRVWDIQDPCEVMCLRHEPPTKVTSPLQHGILHAAVVD